MQVRIHPPLSPCTSTRAHAVISALTLPVYHRFDGIRSWVFPRSPRSLPQIVRKSRRSSQCMYIDSTHARCRPDISCNTSSRRRACGRRGPLVQSAAAVVDQCLHRSSQRSHAKLQKCLQASTSGSASIDCRRICGSPRLFNGKNSVLRTHWSAAPRLIRDRELMH